MDRMRSSTRRLAVLLAGTLIGAAGFSSTAAAHHHVTPACKAHASAHTKCFPLTISGTFSAQDSSYVWSGSTTMKRHNKGGVYMYSGDATYDWHYNPDYIPGCTATPNGGTIHETWRLNVYRSPYHGKWSYIGNDLPGKYLQPVTLDCGVGPYTTSGESIQGAFQPRGASKDLRDFSGTFSSVSGLRTDNWTLTGSN
jgi:hypothetical protein